MKKRFNSTGVCVHRKHYMVDINNKLAAIKNLIDNEYYFTIHKPRQYGKTTTLSELSNYLKEDYLIISISFEGIGDSVFESEEEFCNRFIKLMARSLKFSSKNEGERLINLYDNTIIKNFDDLSEFLTQFIEECSKEIVLFIDEVDKSSNNQLFLSFIGMLRNKYLAREVGKDFTFKSVVLVGLHDVKSLKIKIRHEEEAKYNSPWNIAVDFNVDMSFSEDEISTMLKEYCTENSVSFDIHEVSRELHFFTEGYPFLVSRLCQIIDEKIYNNNVKPWNKHDVQKAVKLIVEEVNTLFEGIVKNLENNSSLYELVKRILILAFIKPIINGVGFEFKEVQISEEKRLDLVITYNQYRYVIEMKIWRGAKYHEEGRKQLCSYLDVYGLDKGYLLIFNFNKNKEFKEERTFFDKKELYEVYV